MRAALIGSPFSGKTIVFEALTGVHPGRKEETMGTIKVPDSRLEALAEIYNPKRIVSAEFVLSDLTAPGARDAALPPSVKNLIQKTDMLIIVLRNFDSVMTDAGVNPVGEYETVKEELIISDLLVIEKRLEREKKEKRNSPDIAVLKSMKEILEDDRFPTGDEISPNRRELVSNYNFLTLKKRIVLLNQPEDSLSPEDSLTDDLKNAGANPVPICATLEKELRELSDEDAREFLESYGLSGTARERFIRNTYDSLGLISFLTVGPDECRAWPVKKGTAALDAAGRIHSDIQRGFIRAETVHYDTFMEHGSEAACRDAGTYRLEGKEYVVQDGDIINFRFNV